MSVPYRPRPRLFHASPPPLSPDELGDAPTRITFCLTPASRLRPLDGHLNANILPYDRLSEIITPRASGSLFS